MPKLHEEKKFKFSFYSNENGEPPHIHVFKKPHDAKIWLNPIEWQFNNGFSPSDQRFINKVIKERAPQFIAAYNEFFSR